jgi:urease accessory protein
MNAPELHAPASAAAAATESPRGWLGRLGLALEAAPGGTRLRRRGGEGPLYVQKPFYPEGDTVHVYLLHPPGGVVGGDRLEITVDVGADAGGLITTPAATKFYATLGAPALQRQVIRVAAGGAFEWLPQETLFFRGCRARVETTVHLARGARYLGWEICCLGRPASGDHFQTGRAESLTGLYRDGDGAPLLLERNLWRAGQPELDARWGLGGFTVAATLVATPADPEVLALTRDRLGGCAAHHPDAPWALTLLGEVLVARLLARHGEAARRLLVEMWHHLRPLIIGREACPPRIWNT